MKDFGWVARMHLWGSWLCKLPQAVDPSRDAIEFGHHEVGIFCFWGVGSHLFTDELGKSSQGTDGIFHLVGESSCDDAESLEVTSSFIDDGEGLTDFGVSTCLALVPEKCSSKGNEDQSSCDPLPLHATANPQVGCGVEGKDNMIRAIEAGSGAACTTVFIAVRIRVAASRL